MKNLKISTLFFALLYFSELSFADDVFKNFTENRFDSTLNVNYFKTESNFAKDGGQQSLPSGYSFQVTDIFAQGRYVLIQDLGLYAGLNVGSSEASDLLATRRNSTLNFVHVGADYLFLQSHLMSFYGDLSYHHAVEKIATDTDSALNNDGASEVHAKITGLFDLDYVQPYILGGVNYRTEGLSTLLTYTIGVQSKFSQLVLGAALNGFASVVDDKKTGTPAEREIITNRVSATSKKFYAINPNLLDSDIYLKYNFSSNLSVQANGGYGIIGSNTALGYHFGAGFNWGFGGSHYENFSKPQKSSQSPAVSPMPAPRPMARPPVPPAPPAPPKKFQEDTNDGVNQDYFKPVKPAKDNYIDKVQDVPPATSVEEDEDFTVNSKKATPTYDKDYKIKLKKQPRKKRN